MSRFVYQVPSTLTPPQAPPPPHAPPPPPHVPPPLPPPLLQPPPHAMRAAEYNVRLAKGTKISVLYHYQPSVPIEYLESGVGVPVSHLIPMTPGTCLSWVDFAYSRSALDGGSAKEDIFFTEVPVNHNSVPILCKKQHNTCQGVKACLLANFDELCGPAHWHTSATCQDVEQCLAAAHDVCQHLSSPQRNIFLHTWVATDPTSQTPTVLDRSCSTTSGTNSSPSTSSTATACPKHEPGASFITSTQTLPTKMAPYANISVFLHIVKFIESANS
ncbi:hypothetical protein B0H14DRAFT_2615876 [Mycena olivaceomarginata]|nr:hypothetical protein B0H14DRAFT_2615876 [Mycena olivaceomarginata]